MGHLLSIVWDAMFISLAIIFWNGILLLNSEAGILKLWTPQKHVNLLRVSNSTLAYFRKNSLIEKSQRYFQLFSIEK